tara:strand:+ start:1002 stop:1874 length:873 start_codon:yes stop_codon:yes gene_type:complete
MNRLIKLLFYKTNWQISSSSENFSNILNDEFFEINFSNQLKNAADPFPFYNDEQELLIYEKVNWLTSKGRIKIIDRKNNTEKLIIKRRFHLSFPTVFSNEVDSFLICESAENNSTFIWKIEENFQKFIEYSKINEKLIDPIIFYKNSTYFLIACKRLKNQEYKMFVSTSKNLIEWNVIDEQNIDITNGNERNAGNIVTYGDNLYRLSQINTPLYGSGIRINRILNITTKAYSEEFVKEIKIKNKYKNVNGFHTLNFYDFGCFYDYRVESFDIFSLFYKIVAIFRKKINNL